METPMKPYKLADILAAVNTSEEMYNRLPPFIQEQIRTAGVAVLDAVRQTETDKVLIGHNKTSTAEGKLRGALDTLAQAVKLAKGGAMRLLRAEDTAEAVESLLGATFRSLLPDGDRLEFLDADGRDAFASEALARAADRKGWARFAKDVREQAETRRKQREATARAKAKKGINGTANPSALDAATTDDDGGM